ncbi:MAG: mechanosensitive ion channel, partial [Ignavibacteriales bacterium]|nr:mechanosensitive ion channel [Ignavibacteriales bacterium]
MKEFFNSIWERLSEIFDPVLLGAKIAAWLNSAIVIILVLVVFYIVWWLVNIILKSALKKSNVDNTTLIFVQTLVKYSFLIIGLITALGSAGIQISAVLASLGIAGLTIGFAAKDALSNIISGILIYLDRPFVIGDLVEIDNYYGKVEKITLRSTRVVTVDGKMLAVPNTEIINKTVISYTNFPHLRIDIPVTISVKENIDSARILMLDIIKDNPAFLADPFPKVIVTQLNDYNVVIE